MPGPRTSADDAPAERVAHPVVEDVVLPGGRGTLALVTVDNGLGEIPTTLGPQGLTELREVLLAQQVRAREGELAAVAVTGADGYLAAGADLRAVSYLSGREDARRIAELGHAAFRVLHEMGVPTFAYVNGSALGGGLELALSCTYRTVAADVTALALPETFLGLVPGWGGCYLLPRIVGVPATLDLVISRPLAGNRMTDAQGALTLGLVDTVLAPEEFLQESVAWTARVLAGELPVPRPELPSQEVWDEAVASTRAELDRRLHGSRQAPYRALELVAAARTRTVDEAFEAEDEALTDLLMSDELRASLYAFDLTTRRARKPAGAPPEEVARAVTCVGIIGAGLMAGQLAVLVARRLKVPVVMREVDDERVAAGRSGIERLVRTMVGKGRVTAAEGDRILASISVSTDVSTIAPADLVVEAVTEVLSLKQRVFAELEGVVSPDAVLASNTSALSVSEMGRHLRHPERVVGLHFFNPVAQMPLVEVVRTADADDATVATAFGVAKALGKTAVGVGDRPGFVVNRLLLRMLAEVAAAVERGTPVEVADRALRPMGLPMGPFALMQLVGLPVALHVLRALHDGLGPRYPLSPGLEKLAEQGRRLVGAPGSGSEDSVDPEIQDSFGGHSGPDAAGGRDVLDAVLGGLTEEVGLMLEERVVDSPEQIDLAMVLGAGWPLHLGGICPYLDRTGWSQRVLGRRLLPPGRASLPTTSVDDETA